MKRHPSLPALSQLLTRLHPKNTGEI